MIYFQEMSQLAIQGQIQGIWFWVAVYTFILCVYSLIFQIQTRYWPFTQGDLVEYRVKKLGAKSWTIVNQDYVSNALYNYNVSGVTHEGTRISPWIFVASHNAKFVLEKQMSALQRHPNGKVKVFYNPKNPKKSFLIVAGKTGVCITLLISVLPLISYYFQYYV